jgi:hypothetical protein
MPDFGASCTPLMGYSLITVAAAAAEGVVTAEEAATAEAAEAPVAEAGAVAEGAAAAVAAAAPVAAEGAVAEAASGA